MAIDSRLTNRQDDPRTKSRSSENRALTENRQASEQAFQVHLAVQQGQLPPFPAKPGFHRIYLSTTNQYDSIHSRLHMGYTPVKLEDLPEDFRKFATSNRGADGFSGCFSVNEMVLCEIEDWKYQQIRKHLEYDLPNQQEESIKALKDNFRDGRGKSIGQIDETSDEIFDNDVPPAPNYD